jgi:hypothetical protein
MFIKPILVFISILILSASGYSLVKAVDKHPPICYVDLWGNYYIWVWRIDTRGIGRYEGIELCEYG